MTKSWHSCRLLTILKWVCACITAILLYSTNSTFRNLFRIRTSLQASGATKLAGGHALGDRENIQRNNALRYYSVFDKRLERLMGHSKESKTNGKEETKESSPGGKRINVKRKKLVPYSFAYDVNVGHTINLMVEDHIHLKSKAQKFSVDSARIDPSIDTLSKLFSHSTSSSVFEIIPKSGSPLLLGEISMLAAVWGHPTVALNVWDKDLRKMYEINRKKNKIGDSLKVLPLASELKSSIDGKGGDARHFAKQSLTNTMLSDLERALDEIANGDVGGDAVDESEVYDPEYVAKEVEAKNDVFLLHFSLCGTKLPTIEDFRAMTNAFRSLFFRGKLPFIVVSICRYDPSYVDHANDVNGILAHDRIGDLFRTFSRANYTAHSLIDLKYLNDYALVTFIEQVFSDSVKKPTLNVESPSLDMLGTQTLLFVHGSALTDFQTWLNPPKFVVQGVKNHDASSKSVFGKTQVTSHVDIIDAAHVIHS